MLYIGIDLGAAAKLRMDGEGKNILAAMNGETK